MRFTPLDPHIIAMQAGTAFARMLAGRYDDALSPAEKTMWRKITICVASPYSYPGALVASRKGGRDPKQRCGVTTAHTRTSLPCWPSGKSAPSG
jgi:hypothetical protein